MIRRHRPGVSLVETLVVMAVGGVILTLSIKMLQQTFASSDRAEQWLDLERSVQQLEYHLRRDLRGAERAELSDPKVLVISTAGSETQYQVLEDRIERIEPSADGSRRVEAYRLPNAKATLSMPSEEVVLVTLSLQSEAGAAQQLLLRQEVGR